MNDKTIPGPSDVQEIANFGLFKIGVDPESSAQKEWEAAASALKQQRSAGIVRQYYDQSYINALSKGDVWITMAWSARFGGQPHPFVCVQTPTPMPAPGAAIIADLWISTVE